MLLNFPHAPYLVTIETDYQLSQTILSVNPWVFHRNPELFGPDCESFNPERWLDADRAKQMDSFLIHVSLYSQDFTLLPIVTFLLLRY